MSIRGFSKTVMPSGRVVANGVAKRSFMDNKTKNSSAKVLFRYDTTSRQRVEDAEVLGTGQRQNDRENDAQRAAGPFDSAPFP